MMVGREMLNTGRERAGRELQMNKIMKLTALAVASASLMSAPVPASATQAFAGGKAAHQITGVSDGWNHSRHHGYRGEHRYYGGRRHYHRADYYDGPVWRGRDGRYHCRRSDGTTGLLIGAAVGGVVGHEVAGRGDRTAGTIIGMAGGALIGRAIDRNGSHCR